MLAPSKIQKTTTNHHPPKSLFSLKIMRILSVCVRGLYGPVLRFLLFSRRMVIIRGALNVYPQKSYESGEEKRR